MAPHLARQDCWSGRIGPDAVSSRLGPALPSLSATVCSGTYGDQREKCCGYTPPVVGDRPPVLDDAEAFQNGTASKAHRQMGLMRRFRQLGDRKNYHHRSPVILLNATSGRWPPHVLIDASVCANNRPAADHSTATRLDGHPKEHPVARRLQLPGVGGNVPGRDGKSLWGNNTSASMAENLVTACRVRLAK